AAYVAARASVRWDFDHPCSSYRVQNSDFLFSRMLPRHPRSTLFPYTTLFRSGSNASITLKNWNTCASSPDALLSLPYDNIGLDGDRKITRLNSSHVAISYAVFCLKKKNSTALTLNIISAMVPPMVGCAATCIR